VTAPTATRPATKKRKKTTKQERRDRWSHRQGPILGAANAASAALAVASVGSLPEVGLDWWWPAAASAVGATAAFTRAASTGGPWISRLYRAGRWAGYGGWCAHTLAAGGPWDIGALGALGAGAVAAAVLAPASRSFEIAAADRQAAEERIRVRAGIAGVWEARINKICKISRPGVRVTDIAEWKMDDPENPAGPQIITGMSIVVELPPGKASWRTIAMHAESLAADADLPDECGIEVASHGSRRRVLLLVSTVDMLARDISAGEDYSPLSIYDDLPVGVYRDGSPILVNLKWSAAALIGATGSGKSAHLAVIMRQLMRCPDVLVWGVDFNGGKSFRPYVRPWLEGRTRQPGVDWVATTEAEAHLLLDHALGAIPARSSGYAALMAEVNDDKVPSSPAIPHIVVITDETADLPSAVKDKLVELSNRSRGVSIRPLIAALRAVSNGGKEIPKPLLAQSSVRTAMRVNEDTELQRLFGFSRGLPKAEAMPAPGYGLFQPHPSIRPRIGKGLLMKPDDSDRAVVETDELRPVLDDITVDVNRAAYLGRWERAASWLGQQAPSATPASPERPAASTGPERPRRSLADLDLGDAVERARRTRRELEERNRARREGPPVGPEDDHVDEFTAILRASFGTEQAAEVPRLLAEAIAACDAVGDGKRVHTKAIAEQVGLEDEEVRRLLRLLEVEPLTAPFRVSGAKARGYARTDLDHAAARIRLGELEVPPEVADAL
jgi:S-DNA-T family DNA segregation ATPase FtsK/SpoIIIE